MTTKKVVFVVITQLVAYMQDILHYKGYSEKFVKKDKVIKNYSNVYF